VLLMSPHILLADARRFRKLDHSEKNLAFDKSVTIINYKPMHFEKNQ
jgi:hypothetical protein